MKSQIPSRNHSLWCCTVIHSGPEVSSFHCKFGWWMILKKVVTFICLGLYHCLGIIHTHTHTTQNPAGLYSERVRVGVQSGTAPSRLTLFSITFLSSGLPYPSLCTSIVFDTVAFQLYVIAFNKVNKITYITKLYVYFSLSFYFPTFSTKQVPPGRFMVLWKT